MHHDAGRGTGCRISCSPATTASHRRLHRGTVGQLPTGCCAKSCGSRQERGKSCGANWERGPPRAFAPMASRDLTRKFVEWRSARPRRAAPGALRSNSREDRSLVGGYASDTSEPPEPATLPPTLPPVWVDLVERVEGDVLKIERATRDLAALHTKRLMVSFDDAGEAALDDEIAAKQREATKLFRACESSLKRVAAHGGDDLSDSERTIRSNIQRSVAMRIQALNTDFRKAQKEYMGRLKSQKEGSTGTFDFLSGGEASSAAEGVDFNDRQLAAVVDVENLVDERDGEIKQIAESIQELSTIFKELAVLVIDQGTVLDRIDFNMEQVAEHTRKGVVEIEKAEQYQKAARPRICIALLLFLITIMMIALILKHRDGDKKDDKK